MLQVFVHAIKIKEEYTQFFTAQSQAEFPVYGNAIYAEILKYQQPGLYSVNSLYSEAPPRSFKQIKL